MKNMLFVLCLGPLLTGCVTIPGRAPVPMPTASAAAQVPTCTPPAQWVAQNGQWVCGVPQQPTVVLQYGTYGPSYGPYGWSTPYYGYGQPPPGLTICIKCSKRRGW
jgi:hypothetical protein